MAGNLPLSHAPFLLSLVSLLLLKVAHRNMLASLVVEFFCNNTHHPINNKSNSRLFDRIKIKIYNFAVADAGEVRFGPKLMLPNQQQVIPPRGLRCICK